MAYEFKLPDIGEGIVEGEIVKWLVGSGDSVSEDQPLVEVMTDKATVEIESPVSGKILDLKADEGSTVKVGATLVDIDAADGGQDKQANGSSASDDSQNTNSSDASKEESTKHSSDDASKESKKEDSQASEEQTQESQSQPANGADKADTETSSDEGTHLASPSTRRFAREQGIALSQVKATGEHGRILKEDVERALSGDCVSSSSTGPSQAAKGNQQASNSETTQSKTRDKPTKSIPMPSQDHADEPSEERIPIRGIRKRIVEKMRHSKDTAAHFTHVDELDVTSLVDLRIEMKEDAAAYGIKLTFLPFIVKAVALSLREFPTLNASVDDEKSEIVLKKRINVGIAVATKNDDLIVPVIPDTDQLSLLQISKAISDLAERAREEKLSPADLKNGTFTITSLGNIGGICATPIINHPEVGILGFHEIKARPAVVNGEIAIRQMAYASLSLDHRIVDGYLGAKFMKHFISLLETPSRMLLFAR